jgi:hypothetical protein
VLASEMGVTVTVTAYVVASAATCKSFRVSGLPGVTSSHVPFILVVVFGLFKRPTVDTVSDMMVIY